MLRRPPRSTRTTHSFPTRRSSDLGDSDRRRIYRALAAWRLRRGQCGAEPLFLAALPAAVRHRWRGHRSEEHTSELQSLMRISYAVFCLKKKKMLIYRMRKSILTSSER